MFFSTLLEHHPGDLIERMKTWSHHGLARFPVDQPDPARSQSAV